MSRFLLQKKKLLEEVFEKASNETTEKTFSGILKSLERDLLDDFRINLSYKSFETYYKTIVENEKDYNIKPAILDDLSRYLEYENFRNYCSDWKTIEYTISETISKIVINITNKPILQMPDFLKKNGLGIIEMAFVLLLVTGGVIFSNGKKTNNALTNPLGIMFGGKPDIEKDYMYWNNDRYKATDSSNLGPQFEVIPMNKSLFKYFKKINREDTLTVENAMGNVWYDKSNNNVEFFTSPGIHPENGKALKDVSETILYNHAGVQTDSLQIEE
ncbi:hypothetical protein ATE47_17505 [Chryseobacterium sp. IHB B 17019]|jgi:hypothetical protein|uniref:hypothetical protein n=1 Tax=Chryseobacterium sp. IHB B 17019 TaxID=1721091 RepID=UPI00071ED70F|nr:hypothetical protein [Chryseobacterium sp. IHB B 17019]ALR32203.1 hypothetical protein ATE47_17505 [Chryseobacterium sp. IHB B 17019]